MSKRLILMRHAEAQPPSTNDFERILTTKGMQQASLAGQLLYNLKIKVDLIAASPATRTKTTANLIAEILDLPDEKIDARQELYNASVRALLSFVNEVSNDIESLLIVAHNPGISYFAEYLTKENLPSFQPAGLAMLQLKIDDWLYVGENTCKFLSYHTPDQVDSFR